MQCCRWPILAATPGLVATAVFVLLLTIEDRTAHAYIDIPVPSLAELCKGGHRRTESIAVLRVEKVNRQKRGIVFSKVRDLMGSFPANGKYFGDTFTHVIRESPNDWLMLKPHNYMDADRLELQNQAILAWAAEGKKAVIFQRDGEHAICVGHLWYTARPAVSGGRPGPDLPYKSNREKPPEKEPWVYGGASDPRFARFFCGDVDELVAAVTDLVAAKKDVTVPRMMGTAKIVSDRTGPVLRFRADRAEFGDRGSFTPDARPKKEYYNPFADQAPWATHRGNAQRTSADDGPGPRKPKILWVHKSGNHFIAPLAPGAKDLFASSLAAFNTASLQAFALDPLGDKQVRWTKGAPLLGRPIAGAPALLGGPTEMLVFGDGFHTSDGTSLRCVRASDGFPLWQLPVVGDLVHFEGTPTIAKGRLYVGGGNAGVLCIEPSKVTYDGKERDLPDVQAEMEKRWAELLANYEVEKKKDPVFTLPPDESMLPRAMPKRLWQQGKDKWHVDAPVAVVEDRVLAASSYLDDEQIGERALVCLHAGDGAVLWKTSLKLNPWAGPTVGPYVLVGCSSIRLDPKAIPGAKGELVAIELDTGKIKWRKHVPGGVLSSVTAQAGMAIFTATDGKVRAWDAFTGVEKWTYDAKAPFFAGPAVAQNTVYAADLKGVVHALNLADGKKAWTLDLGADAATEESGMVYGSPIVHRGRLYLATCNLGASDPRSQNVVVCVGEQ
jgi:outer membrane protein assembly factor BamB